MKFFAVHNSDLESERFLSASNDQVATWLFLQSYCSKQLNGGVVEGAAAFTERFWSRHGISKEIVDSQSPLWSWSGGSLTITPYDIDGQTLWEKKAAGGKAGAEKRWNRTPIKSPDGTPKRSDDASEQSRSKQSILHLAMKEAFSRTDLDRTRQRTATNCSTTGTRSKRFPRS